MDKTNQVNPTVPQPQVITTLSSNSSKFNLKILLIILGAIVAILATATGTAAAIAYEKIQLNQPTIEKPIRQFILSLPFTPKTPKFVLEQGALAHAKIFRHSFNISLAAKSDSFASALGLAQIDAEIKGSVDYSDSKNFKTSINASITKDFNADIRKNDSMVFLKINKIPAFILTLANLDQAKIEKIIQDWIGFDIRPLETEARKTLDSQNQQKSQTTEYIQNMIDDLLDDKLLSSLSLTKETVDNYPSYKIHLTTDDKTIDKLIAKIESRQKDNGGTKELRTDNIKPSDYIKELGVDIWVDQKDYFVREIATSFKFNPNYKGGGEVPSVMGVKKDANVLGAESSLYSLGSSESSIAMVVKFDNFGQEFTVETPTKYLKPEEFFQKIMETSKAYESTEPVMNSQSAGGFTELAKRGRDAARLADLANLQQAINVAVQETTKSYSQVLCNSGVVPCMGRSVPAAINRASNGTGWVKINLNNQKSVSIPTLPVDPNNDDAIHYTYCSDGKSWEINAVLESAQSENRMLTDGGDDDNKYEIGSNLGLIDKVATCKY